MKYWNFEDWAIFAVAVLMILFLLAVIVPLVVFAAKEFWAMALA